LANSPLDPPKRYSAEVTTMMFTYFASANVVSQMFQLGSSPFERK